MRIIRWLLLLAAALVALSLSLAWLAPAPLLYRWFGDRIRPIALYGIEGSLWDGRASHCLLFGMDLGELRWQVSRKRLLRDSLQADVALKGAQANIQGTVSSQGARRKIERANAVFPGALLAPVLDAPGFVPQGEVKIENAMVEIEGGRLVAAAGKMIWRDPIAATADLHVPGVTMSFATRNGHIEGAIEDLGGDLEVDGTLMLQGDAYGLDVLLRSRRDHPVLLEVLKWIGERQADGSSHLRIEGRLQAMP